MIWLWLYLTVGVLNCLEFAAGGGFSSLPEVVFFLLLWPIQLLFAIYAYIILPVINWVGERVLP